MLSLCLFKGLPLGSRIRNMASSDVPNRRAMAQRIMAEVSYELSWIVLAESQGQPGRKGVRICPRDIVAHMMW